MVGDLPAAALEDWLRERYFTARVDVSSSGVADHRLADLRRLGGITVEELDAVVFRDGPSLGADRLRAALADRLRPGPDHVVMTAHGSSEALFLAMTALVRPGDEVVVPDPAYHSLSALARACGAVLRPWPVLGAAPDPADLRALLTPRTRLVVVNFPHNPTGVTVDAAVQAELLDVVGRSGAYLLWDNAFRDLVYDAPPLPEPTAAGGRVLSTGTLSKAHGLPGLRVGWCVLPADLAPELVRVRDYLTLSLSPLTELLAAVAVEHADELIAPRLAEATANRRRLLDWAAAHGVDCPAPGGGVTAFPRFPGVADVTPLCDRLMSEHGVLTVPGGCFGFPGRMRIGFGCDPAVFEAGLTALGAVLAEKRLPAKL
ncbi:aminotransferase [Saccharothrix mutabilis subsp. mutabilis]|uniref:Aminotransferase n=1 Tax=Saccharothrix mutabilis subsp. mutabilis TaxID=66855 RepID=A0ABP3E3I6_9PSEU